MASLFSDEAPLAPPSTALAGFLRFLLLLSSHDWAAAPLVVDPQGELNATDKAAVGEAFSRSRDRGEKTLPMVKSTRKRVRGTENPPHKRYLVGCSPPFHAIHSSNTSALCAWCTRAMSTWSKKTPGGAPSQHCRGTTVYGLTGYRHAWQLLHPSPVPR